MRAYNPSGRLCGLVTVGPVSDRPDITTLGALRPGDRVNLETDVLARYAERLALLPAAPAASPSAAPAEEVRP